MLNNIPIHLPRQPLSLSLSFYITLLMLILILIKWPYCLLLIDYLKVSPYLIQLLMEVETLLLTPTTPQLRIWTAKLYPLTLFLFFLSYSRLSSLWDAAVISPPGLPIETLCQLHPPPPH